MSQFAGSQFLAGTQFAGSQFFAGTELALSAAFGDRLTFFTTAADSVFLAPTVAFLGKLALLVVVELSAFIALQVCAQLFLACGLEEELAVCASREKVKNNPREKTNNVLKNFMTMI